MQVMYLDFLARFQTVFAATLRHQLGQDWDERVVQRVCEASLVRRGREGHRGCDEH